MLLFPEVKIKGLSANTGKHEILPQHRAPCWNHSSQPDKKAEAKCSPLPIPRSSPGTQPGAGSPKPAAPPTWAGSEADLCDQDLILPKMMDNEWLSYLEKNNIGECPGQPRAGTGRGDPQELDTKGIRHAASPGGRAGSQGCLWPQHPTVLPGSGRAE